MSLKVLFKSYIFLNTLYEEMFSNRVIDAKSYAFLHHKNLKGILDAYHRQHQGNYKL